MKKFLYAASIMLLGAGMSMAQSTSSTDQQSTSSTTTQDTTHTPSATTPQTGTGNSSAGSMSGNTDTSGAGCDYIFFNPNLARTVISAVDPGYGDEQGGNLSASLGTATNLHLTCVFDCSGGKILVYTNGVLASTFVGITDPLSDVGREFAYVGRSLYTADAYLTWSLQELRIYAGVLAPAAVAATQALGPNQLLSQANPMVSSSVSGSGLTLSWPLASAGYTVLSTTNLAAPVWSESSVTPQQVGNTWRVNLPVTHQQQFFRLVK